jgi:hypothetical protein
MARPATDEFGEFYTGYINRVAGEDAREVLESSLHPLQVFLLSLPEQKGNHAYAVGKWTIKQVLQHCIDTERIMAYRALCSARGEQQSLPGFDEKDYAEAATAADRTVADLAEELILVRQTTIMLFSHFNEAALIKKGKANNYPITANALAFIMVGHFLHHQSVLENFYLG